jgi:hypothetical protein
VGDPGCPRGPRQLAVARVGSGQADLNAPLVRELMPTVRALVTWPELRSLCGPIRGCCGPRAIPSPTNQRKDVLLGAAFSGIFASVRPPSQNIGAPGSQPGRLGLWAVGGQLLVTWAVRGRKARR